MSVSIRIRDWSIDAFVLDICIFFFPGAQFCESGLCFPSDECNKARGGKNEIISYGSIHTNVVGLFCQTDQQNSRVDNTPDECRVSLRVGFKNHSRVNLFVERTAKNNSKNKSDHEICRIRKNLICCSSRGSSRRNQKSQKFLAAA